MKRILKLFLYVLIFTAAHMIYSQEQSRIDRIFSRFESGIELSFALKNRLAYFAMDLENNDWYRVLNYFDKEHVEAQLNMYLTDDFMFGYLGPAEERQLTTVIKLYLFETLNLYNDGNIEDMELIKDVYLINIYTRHDLWVLKFSVHLTGGRIISGECYIDRETYLFYGAWG